MGNVRHLLQKMRLRPGMWFSKPSLYSLDSFLGGYGTALDYMQVVDPEFDDFSKNFHDWVAYRLQYYESTMGWAGMIENSMESMSEKFELFFQLEEEFHARKARRVATVKPSTRITILRYNEHKEVIYEGPASTPELLEIVRYTDDPGMFLVSKTHPDYLAYGYCPDLKALSLSSVLLETLQIERQDEWDECSKDHPRRRW